MSDAYIRCFCRIRGCRLGQIADSEGPSVPPRADNVRREIERLWERTFGPEMETIVRMCEFMTGEPGDCREVLHWWQVVREGDRLLYPAHRYATVSAAVSARLSLEDFRIMASHETHDPSDLHDALEHVVYEMWKYKQSVAYYGEISRVGGDAAIEFRVLHHRILLEFFYGPAKHPDNIVAWEYVADWQRTHDRRNLRWLHQYMTRCHTMLAHISKTRTEMAKRGLKDWGKEWEIVEPHLNQTIADFLGGLPKGYKETCLCWINRWVTGSHPGNSVLNDLAALV